MLDDAGESCHEFIQEVEKLQDDIHARIKEEGLEWKDGIVKVPKDTITAPLPSPEPKKKCCRSRAKKRTETPEPVVQRESR